MSLGMDPEEICQITIVLLAVVILFGIWVVGVVTVVGWLMGYPFAR